MTLPHPSDIEREALKYVILVFEKMQASHAVDKLTFLKLHGAALERAAEKVFEAHDRIVENKAVGCVKI